VGLSQDLGVVAPPRQGAGEQEDGAPHRQGERMASPQADQDASSSHHLEALCGNLSSEIVAPTIGRSYAAET
jgi:hypothetical protein